MRSTEKSPSRGRIQLTVLIAAAAAFLLVPVAQAAANGTMKVNIEGSGSGEVSSVGGFFGGGEGEGIPPIECSGPPTTGTCENEMDTFEGFEADSLSAFADPGSEFSGWVVEEGLEIFCFEAENCIVGEEGGGNAEVTAVFVSVGPPKFPLTVTKTGSGSGTVTSTPAGIECGSGCEAEFEEGEVVTLSQSPTTGSEFKEWTGACSGTGACEVTMSEAKSVGAKFDPIPRTLTIASAGAGTGTVKCKFNAGSAGACTSPQPNGTAVELIATANAGSEFAGFSGGTGSASACTASPCGFTLEANSSVAATFDLEPTPEFALKMKKTGTGTGTVTSTPAGILCGATCEHEFEEGKVVQLNEIPEPGSEFVKWTGACTGSGVCEVTMSSAKEVTAEFNLKPTPKFNLAIVKAGTGSGSVTCNAGACAPSYEEGEEVTLAATAASGSTFAVWSGGGCSGTAPCTIAIEADTTVTATFTANPKTKETCATNASLCPPPPPPAAGKAKAAASATVKSGKASLKLTCTGGPCKGQVQLSARIKQGKKTTTLVIGKASFSIADGSSTTIKVKLSGPAKSELAKGKALKAKIAGSGVSASTVSLRQAKGGKMSLLVNSRDICNGTQRATTVFNGQNGDQLTLRPPLKSACGKAKKAKRSNR